MSKLRKFMTMIDFEHSLFGLPFAYLGSFLARMEVPGLVPLLWITLAMVSARSAALCLNRLIDRQIDRRNPRTAHWIMASGQLSVTSVWVLVIIFFGLLFFAAAQLNPLCFKLAPLAVLVLWSYSYTKRFTWWCHLLMGIAIGIGPVGGWFAISGTFDWQPFVLGLAVAFWTAGFDTMYACQDIEFDRANNLFSIPARFGEKGALLFSASFHGLAVVCLVMTGVILSMGAWYYAGVLCAAVILTYEHIIVKPGRLEQVNFASFRINHYVGLIIFIMAVADIIN
ncbi:MAG TPA: 4-hydroxybenzoate octaprenyltransferase [Syntrophomonas sp.]|nr:4-hydroxybenzoate octaprenyltransferase [Syntrophomonas sp.]